MNYYEIVYIIHPALQAGHLDDIIKQINNKIEKLKGKVLFYDNWGKKKLSYLIQKQKYGTYVMIQCHLQGNSIHEIASEFEHNTNILRHLISKINEEEIIEQKELNNDVTKEKNVKTEPKKSDSSNTVEAKSLNTENIKKDNQEEIANDNGE